MKVPSQDSLDKAIEIINNEGAQILSTKYIKADNVVLELSVEDMRTIVLRLAEHGFNEIQAINAIDPYEPCRGSENSLESIG